MKKVMLLAPKDLCDTLQSALEDRYITLPCYDPSAGTEILPMHPDILILGLSLPGMDGMTFLSAHADLLPPMIIALTPYWDRSILEELSRLKVTAVLCLPFHLPYLNRYFIGKKAPLLMTGRARLDALPGISHA